MSDGSQAIVSHRASWNDAIQYKYLLSLDGHGAACERLFMSLLSNSVVLKMEATHPLSTRSILYYFPALKAWEHFVPVGEDNITETIKWLIEHDAEAQMRQAMHVALSRKDARGPNVPRVVHAGGPSQFRRSRQPLTLQIGAIGK